MSTQRIMTSFLPVVLCITFALPARSANWWVDDKHDRQWTNKPLAEILSEAQTTNALAQFYVARACFYGSGRSRDFQEAFTWLQRSAERDLPDAQYMLARFFMSGTGTI